MTKPTVKPEILAPCGNLEAFFAAIECGADAVYLGLKEFSARAKAKNFTLAELERMVAYAHKDQRRVYLTLNTLIKERELPKLIEVLNAAEAIGVDALILQDLAVWRLARKFFSKFELHASTQMTIHNTAGVKMLENMGFSRVVLARELSLREIETIHNRTSLMLEHFIHGAHCFSLSGQCHFSSWLGGMSGNRGRCAQPCRRRYYYKGKSGYYFSPNDLSALELLPDLRRAGVMSFKIEGRMTSAEYVASVVNAYRLVLDAAPKQRDKAIAEAKEKLRASFGRLPTKGFLLGPAPIDIVNPAVHGATGLLLGTVERSQAGRLMFGLRQPLHIGDRLRVQPASDKPGTGFTVREMYIGNKSVKQAGKHSRVTIGIPPGKAFRKGDAIFKVSSGQVFSLSEAACRKRLAAIKVPQFPMHLTVLFPDSGRINLIGSCAGVKLQREFSVQAFPAEERPLNSESLTKVFSKTGKAAFTLVQFDCP